MRSFYDLAFEVEGRIGKAVELHSLQIPGAEEGIRAAIEKGQPFHGFSTLTLAEGRRLGSFPSGTQFIIDRHVTDSLDFDVVVNGNGLIILSNRLAGVLREVAANDIELLPVKIAERNGIILRSDFCVVNVVQMLEAISEKKSVRSRDKKSVFRLAVMADKVPPDVHVFRVKEWPWAFLVDDIAKRALIKLPHDGLVFIPVEQE
jgi:hypothetical protein